MFVYCMKLYQQDPGTQPRTAHRLATGGAKIATLQYALQEVHAHVVQRGRASWSNHSVHAHVERRRAVIQLTVAVVALPGPEVERVFRASSFESLGQKRRSEYSVRASRVE